MQHVQFNSVYVLGDASQAAGWFGLVLLQPVVHGEFAAYNALEYAGHLVVHGRWNWNEWRCLSLILVILGIAETEQETDIDDPK